MNMKKHVYASALSLLFLANVVSAVSIGAGPSTIEFGRLVKGGYAEETLTVSTSGDEDLTCVVEFTGDLKDWLSIDKGDRFNLPANSRVKMKAIVQPPPDAPNGEYEGAIYIKAAPTSTISEGTGLIVGAGVKVRVFAEVSGEEYVSLLVENLRASDTEVGYPIVFGATLRNTGNVKFNPRFVVGIKDAGGVKVLSGEYDETVVLPTREEVMEFTISSKGLSVGSYTADVNVYGQGKLLHNQILVVNLLSEGTWRMGGVLEDIILSPESASAGDTVKVTAVFKNTGEVKLKAKLKSEAHMGGKLKDVLTESDELTVQPGETVSLDTYYTVGEAGNYIVRGYVLYSGQQTDTKSSLLKVSGGGGNLLLYIIIAVVLLAVAAYFLFIRGGGEEEYGETIQGSDYGRENQDALSQQQGGGVSDETPR
jgi:uncharacterized protein YaiE (UPF0345 family)